MEKESELKKFWGELAGAKKRVLMLDYDGTLSPFRKERDKALPYPGVREILDEILETACSRLVIISGRWTKDIIPLLGLKSLPEIWGSHGLERKFPDGRAKIVDLDRRVREALTGAYDLAVGEGFEERLERKPGALALHWRGLDPEQIDDIRGWAVDAWSAFTTGADTALYKFDGGIELRSKNKNKGDAVSTILAEEGEDCCAAYLGDDQTDEDAFHSLKGKGLSVLVREEFRDTEADIWLRPPDELLEFLGKWYRVCTGKAWPV
ncbi:MAG: trehalose-phosphatase [Planctomycetota bacterium]|nr:MAG: trehalose-phosphatase [Planctomycetota bacterium]